MNEDFECRVCGQREWQKHKVYTYDEKTMTKKQPFRRHVLFNVWFPGEHRVQITSLSCKKCGFMCYTPRPTEEELGRKYEYLGTKENVGAINNPTERALQLNAKRTNRIYRVVKSWMAAGPISILDYGGGDGRLLKNFVAEGNKCFVVDFNEHAIPGVERIGSTIDDIPTTFAFDAIICSHVLEHVEKPVELLRRLKKHLKPEGVIYVEIPLEIYKEIPIRFDPVTHINFFTTDTLKLAAGYAGFRVKVVKASFEPYGEKYKRVGWMIISADITADGEKVYGTPQRTIRLLHPGLTLKASRFFGNLWLKRVLNKSIISDHSL
jgi:SAM-dependent methyltransferase